MQAEKNSLLNTGPGVDITDHPAWMQDIPDERASPYNFEGHYDSNYSSGTATPARPVVVRDRSTSVVSSRSASMGHGPSQVSSYPQSTAEERPVFDTRNSYNGHLSIQSTAELLPYNKGSSRSRLSQQVLLSDANLGVYEDYGNDRRLSSTSMNSNYKRAGQIVRLHDRDDAEQWKGAKRYLYFLAPFLIAIDVLIYLGYLGFRLYCNIDVQQRTGISAGAAWVFVGVEFLITIPYLMNNAWALFSLKSRTRPRLRLTGDSDVPTLDVFVTCCGEDTDVVMDTVKATCDQDYPIEKFRVIILDDGKSAELEQEALEAAKIWPNLFYMSREKVPGVPHHFKAGNLNYGLEQICLLPGGTAEYVGALDAE